jgi:hypothetical protein
MEAILAAALEVGPATVLTNGLLLDERRCARLAALAGAAEYSLDVRVSLDGWDAADQRPDPRRRHLRARLAAIVRLHDAGLNPVVTVTEVSPSTAPTAARSASSSCCARWGSTRPRLKVLPTFQLGAEAERTGAYASWQRLREATPRRAAGTTSSARAAAWSPTRGCGCARSWSTSRPLGWARRSPTRSARSSSPTPPAGPVTWTA